MPMHRRPMPARSLSARAPRAGCQNKKLLPLLEGAPNFRQARAARPLPARPGLAPLAAAPGPHALGAPQVPELPVYGVAIPTVSGLRLVLDKLGAEQGRPPGAQHQHGLVALLARLCTWRRVRACPACARAWRSREWSGARSLAWTCRAGRKAALPPGRVALAGAARSRGAAPVYTRDRMGGAGRRKVIWANMREEPVLYINGKPYVVRESTRPFANLEYTGARPPWRPVSAPAASATFRD